MKKLNFVIYLTALLLMVSCVSPMSLYKKGDYYKATLEAVKKLRSKPDNIAVQDVLKNAYPKAQEVALRTINSLQYSKDANKYYSIVNQYNMLNALTDEISRCPKASELVTPTDYSDEAAVAKEAGAEAFYQMGTEALADGSIRAARLALTYFDNTKKFVSNYKDVNQLINQANELALLRVMVRKPLINRSYQLSSDFFFNNFLSELRWATQNKKVIFFEEGQTQKINSPHQTILLDFVNFNVGNSREHQNVTHCKKDSVLTGYTTIDGQRYPVYGTVKATYTEYRLEVLSSGVFNAQIIDFKTNRVERQQKFSGEYLWTAVWATYQGDERALNNKQLQMCRRRMELPPSPQDLFVEFTKPILSKAIVFLNNYYKNY